MPHSHALNIEMQERCTYLFGKNIFRNKGDGVPDSVVAARGAGIRVVMITGDYLLTAIAIAKNATCRDFPPIRRNHGSDFRTVCIFCWISGEHPPTI